jgi:hypothetical protein
MWGDFFSSRKSSVDDSVDTAAASLLAADLRLVGFTDFLTRLDSDPSPFRTRVSSSSADSNSRLSTSASSASLGTSSPQKAFARIDRFNLPTSAVALASNQSLTRNAMQHKRSNGQRVGNLAYGYRSSADGKHVEVEPSEQVALAQIRGLRQQGRSLREIAASLNGQALRTRRGARWRHDHILRIVRSVSVSG